LIVKKNQTVIDCNTIIGL